MVAFDGYTQVMGCLMDGEIGLGVSLLPAYPSSQRGIEDLGAAAGDGVKAVILQQLQSVSVCHPCLSDHIVELNG